MASLRDIKRKIKVVKNISQITQAMKMVAAAKLRRVQERVEQGKPYAQTMNQLVGTLAPNVREFEHPLLESRETHAVGIVVVAADKGLCGSYNSNILRRGHRFVDEKLAELGIGRHDERLRLITIGRKATDYFRKRDYPVTASYASVGVDTPYVEVRAIADAITGLFLNGQVDEVHIAYTEFVNTIVQKPMTVKFLPIEPPASEADEGVDAAIDDEAGGTQDFIFEPGAPELLGVLLPRFVETQVYQLLLEATASEFGARMTAMTNATKNANEQIDALTLIANRTRQAAVTNELLDIVGGAEALKG
jgi:F-type H+-transporting ATPase subunit gamma